jgi:teichuronic acid exporter
VVALGTGFVVAGFRTVPGSVLQKELEFRTLALMEGAQAVAVAAATVLFALAGLGYWTLVLGTLLGGALSTALAVAWRPHGFARPRPAELRRALAFSGHVLGTRLSWYVYANADFFVVGRALGERALGYYSFAWSLASIPIGKVSAMILRVTPAHFAAVQDDPPALRRYFLTLSEGLALATFPATVGLALVADDFVLAVLGEKWRAAIPVLRLLALYASLRSVTPLLPQVLNATGDARFAMRNSVVSAVLLPLAFVAGSRWGVEGVAVAWMLVHPLCILPLYLRVCRRLDATLGDCLRALQPALGGCALMAAAVWATDRLTPDGIPPLASLAVQVAAGAAAYGLAVYVLHRERLRAFRALMRS